MSVSLESIAELPEALRQLQEQLGELGSRVRALEAAKDDGLVSAKTAAELLDMSPAAVRQAAYRGDIPSIKVGRRLRFRRSELPR